MRINPYLFFLPKAPHFIIWDYKTHQQYELDLAHSKRLIELIHDISLYDNTLEIDSTFFHNSIIQESTSLESHWGWDDLSKIFHIGTKDFSFPEQPTDAKSWADRYMTHCQEVMKKDIPGANRFAHLKAEDLIRLPIPLPNESLGALLQGQHFIDNLPFGIFITSRFDKLWWKYPHSRAYRVALLEAGHISQTIQLIATAMGLNTWLSAAINDAKVEKALGMEDLREQLILFVGGGYSNGKVFCDEFEALLTKR